MRVVVASDKFKGSLTAEQVAHHVAVGLRRVVPDLEVVQLPVADGGDGTLAATCAAGFELVPVRAEGPTGVEVGTGYAVRDGVAVVELADVSGLAQLPGNTFAPMAASSYAPGRCCGPRSTQAVGSLCSAWGAAPARTLAPGWCRHWGAACTTGPVQTSVAAGAHCPRCTASISPTCTRAGHDPECRHAHRSRPSWLGSGH